MKQFLTSFPFLIALFIVAVIVIIAIASGDWAARLN